MRFLPTSQFFICSLLRSGVELSRSAARTDRPRPSDPHQLLATVQKKLAETGSHLSISRCTPAFIKVENILPTKMFPLSTLVLMVFFVLVFGFLKSDPTLSLKIWIIPILLKGQWHSISIVLYFNQSIFKGNNENEEIWQLTKKKSIFYF